MFPKHWITWAESRNYDVEKMTTNIFICEWEGCMNNASSIHHIENSFRAKRKDDDGKILIALCYKHHKEIHDRNNFENRLMLFQRVLHILENKDEGKKV